MATSSGSHRVFIGLGFLAVGVLLLLDNLTNWEIPWGGWWPVILIAIGVWNLVGNRAWCGGLIITGLGVFFLLDTQDIWDYTIGDIWRFWPVILILIGAKMLLRRRRRPSPKAPKQHVEDKSVPGELNIISVFGSNQRRVTDQGLGGGQVVSVFGSTEINLLDASLAAGEATLEVTAVFGGAKIRVPDSWKVDMKVAPLLGSAEDKRESSPTVPVAGRLVVTGTCVFGGIEVES